MSESIEIPINEEDFKRGKNIKGWKKEIWIIFKNKKFVGSNPNKINLWDLYERIFL